MQATLINAALFNHLVIVDMLLAAGADATIADDIGNRAFSVAEAQGNQAMITRLSGSAYSDQIAQRPADEVRHHLFPVAR